MPSARFLSLLSFVTISLFFSTTNASSRSLSIPHKTTVLNVASSVQQTQHILSIHPTRSSLATTRPEFESKSIPLFLNSSSPLTLQLHSRDTLFPSQHNKDYKTLVLSRLERDSSRVAGIFARVRFSVDGIDRSDLKPVHNDETTYRPEELTTPVVSGVSQGSGEYFSRIGVGTPAKEMYKVLDTGSDVNWLQCKPCSDCYQQSDPVFDPAERLLTHVLVQPWSSTYESLTCSAPQCASLEVSACRSNKCLYQVSYGDGSFTERDYATETVTFGNSGKVNDVALGCGHDNEGLFTGAAGLLGLGGGPLSMTNQINATSFSYCLVDRDSGNSSSLDFNSVQIRDGDATAPLLRNSKIDTFYYVGLSGFSVGGEKVAIPSSVFEVDAATGDGGVILDCGTAVSRLQTEAYDSLRDAFSIDLPAKNYLIPIDDEGTFCFAFALTSSELLIIRNVQQQGIRITYDLANNLIGLSAN
ncbi:hypothetical protein Bca52824_018985 [Brassica carinata]|uniref:Peptidase A1 domain-containing protein n=1 Tax=Brassica carinata TaxID=52824 RepID=A0A8X8AZ74_BRACI|nr:hypothetical protein Bca52824_018985 [Brassica carinata]